MPTSKITLYVDIVSPFAYMGYWLIRNSPAFKECDVTYVPIFLGGVMKMCGTQPPLTIKNKDKWIDKERLRWAKLFNISMPQNVPDGFPVLTLTTMRVLCALELSDPSKVPAALDALYRSFWPERNESKVDKPDGIIKCLSPVLGEDEAKRIVKEGSGDAAKKRLNQNSEKAFNEGAFGLPWIVATNEKGETDSFWGVDHFGMLVQHLGVSREKLGGGYQAMI